MASRPSARLEPGSAAHSAAGTTILALPMPGPRRPAGPHSGVSLPLRTCGSPGGGTASRFRHGSGGLSPGPIPRPCRKDLHLLACARLKLSFPYFAEGDSVPRISAPVEMAAPDRMPGAQHPYVSRGQSVPEALIRGSGSEPYPSAERLCVDAPAASPAPGAALPSHPQRVAKGNRRPDCRPLALESRQPAGARRTWRRTNILAPRAFNQGLCSRSGACRGSAEPRSRAGAVSTSELAPHFLRESGAEAITATRIPSRGGRLARFHPSRSIEPALISLPN